MTLQISILDREKLSEVSAKAWDELSVNSQLKNPFFARDSLLSALNCIDLDKQIFLVAAYQNSQLCTLFPIEIKRHRLGFRCIHIWRHQHCFLSDPLSLNEALSSTVIVELLNRLKISCFMVERHSPMSLGQHVHSKSIINQTYRGQVSELKVKHDYYSLLSSKVRSESKRVVKRMFRELDITYRTSNDYPEFDWFNEYCQLEHKGWKAGVSGSILSQQDYYQYYQGFAPEALKSGKIEYQGLFIAGVPVAMSVRMIDGHSSFDIKTSFDETYKKFYPGVVLEILNLNDLQGSHYDIVDSCTHEQNNVVNRLWPEQKIVYESVFFRNSVQGIILNKMLISKRQRDKRKLDKKSFR